MAAFRSLLGRAVHVHPYNRLSGALGAALLAAEAHAAEESEGVASGFLGFDACSRAELSSFECGACDNRCQVIIE